MNGLIRKISSLSKSVRIGECLNILYTVKIISTPQTPPTHKFKPVLLFNDYRFSIFHSFFVPSWQFLKETIFLIRYEQEI